MPRGRPKGSKNKPKTPQTIVETGIIKGETNDIISPVVRQTMINSSKTTSPPIEKEKPLPSEKKKESPSKSDDEKRPYCERCHKIVYCEPFRCDTNVLTGRADYHRLTPRYAKLCSECSKELSDLVDEWLFNKGKGVKPKLGG